MPRGWEGRHGDRRQIKLHKDVCNNFVRGKAVMEADREAQEESVGGGGGTAGGRVREIWRRFGGDSAEIWRRFGGDSAGIEIRRRLVLRCR